jgi:hypothetical protein
VEIMSKKDKEKLSMADFMFELLSEVKVLNSNLQSIVKSLATVEQAAKLQMEFLKNVSEKGVITRAR